MIYKQPKEATTELTYTRSGAATAWRKDGTLAEFAPNVIRRTDRGVLIEGQATNLVRYSRQGSAKPSGTVAVPAANANHVEDGRACMSGTFPEIANGDIGRCQVTFGEGVTLQTGLIYSWAATIKLGRPLVDGEIVWAWFAGWQDLGRIPITASSQQNGWSRIGATKTSTSTGNNVLYVIPVTLLSPLTVYCTDIQLEQASYTSSPIITTGAAATRGADDFYINVADTLFRQPYTVLVEIDELTNLTTSNFENLFFIGDQGAVAPNRITVYRSTNALVAQFRVDDVIQTLLRIDAIWPKSGPLKAALTFDGINSYRLAARGMPSVSWVASKPFSQPLSRIDLFKSRTGGWINASGRRLVILPYALTDEELIKLTSPNDTTFDYLSLGGVYYYDAGQTAMPRKSQVVAPISSGRELIL